MVKKEKTKTATTFMLLDEYKIKLDKIRSNYSTKLGKPFNLSGIINLILKKGFAKFEEEHRGVSIDNLKIKQKELTDEES
jgi:hypothetical protein